MVDEEGPVLHDLAGGGSPVSYRRIDAKILAVCFRGGSEHFVGERYVDRRRHKTAGRRRRHRCDRLVMSSVLRAGPHCSYWSVSWG